jgi:predicted nucleotidyltransferase
VRDLDALRTVIETGPELRFAVLFGSAARAHAGRGVWGPDSDVDVGVWPQHALTLADENDLASRLEAATGRRVDLVRLDLASPSLAFRVARDAVPLFVPHRRDLSRWLARVAIEHAEFQPTLDEGLERYRRALLRSTT